MAETVKIVDLDIDEKDLLKKLTKLTDEITKLKTETKSLETENKKLSSEGKKNTAQYKENSKQIEVNKVKTKGLSTEYRDNQKVLVTLNTTETKQLGTLQKLELSNKKLRQESKTLDLTRKDGQARLKDINKQLDQNNKTVLENADATKKQKMNIGNYGSALQGLPGPLGGAASGIINMTKAAIAFIATPLGAILAAIAAVIKLVAAGLKNSQPLMDLLNEVGAAIGATFNVLLDRMSNFAEFLGRIFSKELRDAHKEAQVLNDELIGIDETMSRREKRQKRRENRKSIAEEIKEEAKQARDLKEAYHDLEDQEIKDITRKADLRKSIEKARLESKNANITEQERLVFLQDAMRFEEELLDIEVATATERARISQEEVDMGRSSREEMKENAMLQAKVTETETASMKRKRTIASELKTVEIKAAKEKLDLAEAAALIAARAVDNEIQLERIKSLEINEIKDADVEKDIERAGKLAVVYEAAAEHEMTLADLTAEAKFDLAQGFAGDIATIFGKESAVGKAAAIAETTINTYRAAQASYASLAQIPIIGVPLGIAAAGAAVTMGIANVKKILAVKTPGGGGGGGGIPSGGGLTSVSTGRRFTPNAYTADGGTTTMGMTDSAATAIKQGLSEALKESPPVLVIEDVTRRQMQQDSVSKVTTI